MLRARYTTKAGDLSIEIEGKDVKDLFMQVAMIQDAFDAETQCGLCASEDLRYQVRVVGKYTYYEQICRKCGAKFAFGQHQGDKGTLFPRRKDKEKVLPNRGWTKWNEADPQQVDPQGA